MFAPVIDVHRKRGAGYCGPNACTILTGVPLSKIEDMIRRRRKGWSRASNGNKLPIRGTYPHEIKKVLKALGCKITPVTKPNSTFGQFVRNYEHSGTFLVEVTGHFMVCEKLLVADSSYLTPTHIDNYPKATRRVVAAWRVVAPATPKYTLEHKLQAVERRAASQAARKTTKPDVKVVRANKIADSIKRWERKEKLAKTKLKKLRASMKRYEKVLDQSSGELP